MVEQIDVDLANVFAKRKRKDYLTTLAWGDRVEVVNRKPDFVEIGFKHYVEQEGGGFAVEEVTGYIEPGASGGVDAERATKKASDCRVLKVDFVDVQQGDGSVIETPSGQVVLIDGGDNQLFARYLAARYPKTTEKKPKDVECIVVTHGDADHFAGLTQIHGSELHETQRKRLFMRPKRVFHNGLVKRPSSTGGSRKKRPDLELLGATKAVGGEHLVTGMVDDLLKVPDKEMNAPFLAWKNALRAYHERGPMEIRRLEQGDDDAFAFLADDGIKVEVLAPIVTERGGVRGLKFFGSPPRGPRIGHDSISLVEDGFGAPSASHTINGHSIVLKVTYGRFSFLFTGDLNDESGRSLVRAHNAGALDLEAEVFKVPHHGSADFSGALLKAVSPVISVVSSGDETRRKEYIHPRATLMGALGRHSRVDEPLIFVTELVAFFNMVGYVNPEKHRLDANGDVVVKNGAATLDAKAKGRFFAFSRTDFGIVKIRTDGTRLLVYTNSGQDKLKEAYAFMKDKKGNVTPDRVVKI